MADLSTHIQAVNNTLFSFKLVDVDIPHGEWDIPPPRLIPPQTTTATFVLNNISGSASGSEGSITYAFDHISVDILFCNSRLPNQNFASITTRGNNDWYKISVAFAAQSDNGDWHKNSCPSSGHPLYVTYTIDAKYPRRLTDKEYNDIQPKFPKITQQTLNYFSGIDNTFNGIAWSMDLSDVWINPTETVEQMVQMYTHVGDITHTTKRNVIWKPKHNYALTEKGSNNANIDLMCSESEHIRIPKHATRKYKDLYFKDPIWTSKAGKQHLIEHSRDSLESSFYGNITHSFVKKIVEEQNENILLKPFPRVYHERQLAIMSAPFDVKQMAKLNNIVKRCDTAFRTRFEERYACWNRECANIWTNNTYDYVFLHSFRNLAIMGSGILPLVVKKMSLEQNFHTLPLYERLQLDKMLLVHKPSIEAEDTLPLESEQSRARRTVHRYLQYLP